MQFQVGDVLIRLDDEGLRSMASWTPTERGNLVRGDAGELWYEAALGSTELLIGETSMFGVRELPALGFSRDLCMLVAQAYTTGTSSRDLFESAESLVVTRQGETEIEVAYVDGLGNLEARASCEISNFGASVESFRSGVGGIVRGRLRWMTEIPEVRQWLAMPVISD